MSKALHSLTRQVADLTQAAHRLRDEQSVAAFCFRNDRDAAHFCGFKSPWRFSLWATARGLKPKLKANAKARTVYLVSELQKACEADKAEQFKG